MGEYRVERDSMGEVKVPADALYGAQTQRAVENFRIGSARMPRVFIESLGLIKWAAAGANEDLGLLSPELSAAIQQAALEVTEGAHDEHFPIVIYQTGSGTSTNMNANEVIATRASQILGRAVHPNDHVNMGQSSNDVIPTAIHVSACIEAQRTLLPALARLREALDGRAADAGDTIKTGRTHLMDAMPLRLSQQIGGWSHQTRQCIERIEGSMPRLECLALGGTAVGTGINAPSGFAALAISRMARRTGIAFRETEDHFSAQASQDAAAEFSGQLKATATAMMKIANDLRWMNSGPIAGLGEITLPALQPGSSIMPGKVNPVMCEALMMVSAQVMGNDTAIAVSNSMGNFELNVMLPLIAHNLIESIQLLGQGVDSFTEKAVRGFTINAARMAEFVEMNPILVTALNPVIGYDKAAAIAKRAYAEGRRLKDVAAEMTDLSPEELDRLLDPGKMT